MNLPHDEQLAFGRLLERTLGHGFRLVVVELSAPVERAELVDWVRARTAADVREIDARGAFSDNPLDALGALDPPLGERSVVVLTGLESTERGAEGPRAGALQALNVQRDTLVSRFPCFWILVLHPSLRQQAQAVAPDFLDYASLWVEADAAPPRHLPRLSPGPDYFTDRVSEWSPVEWEGVSTSTRVLLDAAWEHLGRNEADRVRDLLARVRLAEGHDASAMAAVVLVETWLDGPSRGGDNADRLAALAESPHLGRRGRAVARVGEAKFRLLAGDPVRARTALRLAEPDCDAAWRLEALGTEVELLELQGAYDDALGLVRQEIIPGWTALGSAWHVAGAMSLVAAVLVTRGDLEAAMRIRRDEQLPIYERLGDARSQAHTKGAIASILAAQGHYAEALRMRRHEQLPVYEELGDAGARAVALGGIANLLEVQGDYTEALRIRREEEIPLYDRTGNVRARALAIGRIAGLLQIRGEYEEALRIRLEEEIPVYERLGDVQSRAVCLAHVAEIHMHRGDYDRALSLWKDEVLPVLDRLGDVRHRAVTVANIAMVHRLRGESDEALRLLRTIVLPCFLDVGDTRGRAVCLGTVATILTELGRYDEALTLFRDQVVPVLASLGEARELAVFSANMAFAHAARNRGADRKHARRILDEVIPVLGRLGLPELEVARRMRQSL